jgi:hypothetical protein
VTRETGPGRPQDAQESTNTPDPSPSATPEILGPQSGAERLRAGLDAWRAAGSPTLDPIQRAAANPTSRALAIAAKCYDCQGCDADPGPTST